jgi:probable blue pigment (indigoidine) exporter
MAVFFSGGIESGQVQGFGLLSISLLSMVLFWLLSRKAARDNEIKTLPLTSLPLALGGGLLIFIALPLEGVPPLPPLDFWPILIAMMVLSTALGFFLYNHALQTLTAFEMNVLISAIPLLTALIASAWLGEQLSSIQFLGMFIAVFGVILVQLKKKST